MVVVCKSFTDHRPFFIFFWCSSNLLVNAPGCSLRPREEEGEGGEAAEWREVAQGEWRATQQRKKAKKKQRRPTRKSEKISEGNGE